MKRLSVPKGQVLQRKGDTNSKVFEVDSGLLRSYTIDSKGKEHIYMFAPKDWIVADSNPPDTPCELFIDALEDSEVRVYEKSLDINLDPAKVLRRFQALQKRILLLMSASAIDRYEQFEADYPQILQRVPQRMIASYLGITPEALSKVKSARRRDGKSENP